MCGEEIALTVTKPNKDKYAARLMVAAVYPRTNFWQCNESAGRFRRYSLTLNLIILVHLPCTAANYQFCLGLSEEALGVIGRDSPSGRKSMIIAINTASTSNGNGLGPL